MAVETRNQPNVPQSGGGSYRMAGIPDGLGAFDNGDGTLTVLMNQELPNTAGIVIGVRKCSEPNEQLRTIQSILLIKPKPFTKRKSVVHKPELKKNETQYLRASPPI